MKMLRAMVARGTILIGAGALVPASCEASAEETSHRKCVVIGSGIAGVSTALQLARRGYEVTVIDAAPRAALGCSEAAAGGMQRMAIAVGKDTWFSTVAKLMPWGHHKDPTHPDGLQYFRMRWGSVLGDLHFMRWLATFTRASLVDSEEKFLDRVKQSQAFGNWSIDMMLEEMAKDNGALAQQSGLTRRGALKLLYTQDSLDDAKARGEWTPEGSSEPTVVLSPEEVAEVEPWVRHVKHAFVGAVFQTEAASANCEWTTQRLAEKAEREYGMKFRMSTTVKGFRTNGDKVSAIETSSGDINLQDNAALVIAAGAWTAPLLCKLGVFCPIYPLKGYNLVIDVSAVEPKQDVLPTRVVATHNGKMYIARYHDQIRCASVGEFAGFHSPPSDDVDAMMRLACKSLFPSLCEAIDAGRMVTGLRPYAADGCAIMGKVPGMSNVYVNTGPGSNGWKCGLGAGEFLARLIDEGRSGVEGLGFDPATFLPEGRCKKAPLFSSLCRFAFPKL